MSKEFNLGRKNFIKLSLLTFGVGILAGKASRIAESYQVANAPRSGLYPKEALQSTATALRNKGEDNSFVPEGLFSKEVFNKIRLGTYINEFNCENYVMTTTAWCVKKVDNFLYFVTCTHGNFNQNNTPGTLEFRRPNIDAEKIKSLSWKMVVDDTRDLTLMKCEFNPEDIQNKEPLAYRDNHNINKDQKLLMVGFPAEFGGTEDSKNTITLGSVITIVDKLESNDIWVASGVNNFGGSGSPVACIDESGTPVVIGVVSGIVDYVEKDGLFEFKKTFDITGRTLKIDALMTAIDK